MTRSAAALALVACAAGAGCGTEAANGRPWVHDLRLSGVRSVSRRDLKSRLAIEKTSWFPFAPKRYLDPLAVDMDRERIEAYYRAHGWFSAHVTDATVTPRKGPPDQPKSVDVHFTVEEGAPTHTEEVTISGLPKERRAARLAHAFESAIKRGAIFNHDHYLDAKQALEDGVRALGYAWSEVKGEVSVDRDTHQAKVKMTVVPGVRAVFGRLSVEGTSRVSTRDVERHAALRSGTRFDPAELEELRGRIYDLGVFSSVKVEVEKREGHPEIADVKVTVQEATFNQLRIGLGVGLESQRTDAHASFIYNRRNFLGGLRSLELELAPAWVAIPAFWNVDRSGPAVLADAELTQPDFPWPRAQLKWTLGYDVGIEYAYQYHGPRTSLELSHSLWNKRLRFGLSYHFQLLLFFNTDPVILEDPAQAGELFGYTNPYRLGWWQEDVTLDLRDHRLDAHSGFYAAIGVEQGGAYAGGAFQYEKLTPEVRGYIPLGPRVTFAARILFGQIFSQGDLGSPVTRRFYLGGPSSHRGFAYGRLSRQVPSGLPGVPPIPIGGDQMLLVTGELRVDLFKIAGYWLSLAAFVDGGDVSDPSCNTTLCKTMYTHTSIDLGDLHWATGGGLRYKTVIGTLRVDLGVRLNRLAPFQPDGEPNPDPGQRFAFHLSVGEAF